MLHKIKRRLVLLFGSITSCILILIILFLYLNNQSDHLKLKEELYQTNISNIIDNLASATQINTSWISQIQTKSNILVVINDNGEFLHLLNTYQTPIEPDILVSELTELAKEDGFLQSTHYSQTSIRRSSTYVWHKHESTSYRGTIAVFHNGSYRRTLYLIGVDREKLSYRIRSFLFYLFSACFGSLLLFLFSSMFIGHILKPVQEGQKQQADFICAVSHELKSPLSVISSGIYNLKLLLNHPKVDDESLSKCRKSLPTIQNECSRASRLINDMLLLAASDTKSWQIQEELVNMDTLMIDLYDHYLSLEEALQNKFQFDLPESDLFCVRGDTERIRQIITILIDNAIRYTDPSRGITLRAYNQENFVHIEVIDYGSGIPDSIKEKVFNRFYRMDTSRKEKNNFGLGLSIAKELTLLHKGRIYVKDTPEGGATFCVELPKD